MNGCDGFFLSHPERIFVSTLSSVPYVQRRNYFQFLEKNNILRKVKVLLEQAGYYVRHEDGKIYADLHLAWDYPWHHVKRIDFLDCHLWHRIMFDIVGGFVPMNCQNCFKVVVKPQTLKQLFALLDLQIRLDLPAKCGVEDRKTVFGSYGGYFYNVGFENGIECYMKVRDSIKEDEHLRDLLEEVDDNGVPKRVILKRGCTEMEHALGRSDKWQVTEEQIELEKLVNNTFVRQPSSRLQPDIIIQNVHQKWIEFAWDRGDPTVLEFTDGYLLYPPYMTYHYIAEGLPLKTEEKTEEAGSSKGG